jgi:hypothetical protein
MAGDPMALDFSDLVVHEVLGDPVDPGIIDGVQALPYYGPPGSKANCPDCGRELTLTGTGQFRGHKCVNGQMSAPAPGQQTPGSAATPQPGAGSGGGKRKTKTPPKVMTLWDALGGSVTEWSAREVVHRNTGAPKPMIPAELSDDDTAQMFEPVMEAIWPRLPKGAQKAISAIAEEAGLILAAITWADYLKTLSQFQREYRQMTQVQQAPTRPQAAPRPSPAPQPQGAPNGVVQGSNGQSPHPFGFEPFAPAE